MIERRLYEYLNANADVPAYTEVEAHMPSRYYLIERTGGGKSDYITRATVAIRSYGESLADSALLNDRLKEIMAQLPTQKGVSRVSLNSDYNNTDTRTRAYRYQAVFDIVYYD